MLTLRHAVQANAEKAQPATSLPDQHTETYEMFQYAGKKGDEHFDPDDPPHRHGTRGHLSA